MNKDIIKVCAKKFIESQMDLSLIKTFEKYVLENLKTKDFIFPFSVAWQITSRCNLRCKHCYYIDKDYSSKEITKERFKEILDELNELGIVEINLTGGEPFIRKDIFEIISYIKQKNIALKISTNATLINYNTIIIQKE